ncbi:MAG: DUF2065 domain-containing protein [Gammaproteobacteria bacterium]|nr:MAG: DUF2065 domain-containing protein [Gammaproteobacteria bacterium]
MWSEFLTAIALVFIIEGIMPFCNPAGLRKMFVLVASMADTKLRFIGLTSMLSGLVLLYLVR